ncbi:MULTISPECIES: hypothetical protein [Treponema]|uniref:Bacterial repeat domain-containing protein n=1 Tax=Treponema denticola (strain ATCC 35405 / DSM 14222 / CIP 103919 / JCM 8153 / KCTC 15104) TaxID=243275 RepID=Q73LD2_TREDE|nr:MULTISPECIES: hypothetical protein [Treponema]AAS12447.1 hypothetical protein TDE_1933 [Treponema denticola ATCC 35405]EMB38269.1 hypothetical protein HMPREF9735_01197 [Treponema denticola ATCC 33521]EMB39277.1 hypothetical protein HMPREF9721_00636 [Treponema denticola ATCC 35404]HCY95875.1 hypothetical protein [Treponema sp.]
MKRPLNILIAAVAVILLFTACQQFLEDPEDFLSYWASEAFVKDHSIGSAHRPDNAGVPCVGSSEPVDITLSVHNPKGFSFVMPASSAPAGIVEFKELSSQPTAETDYALERTGFGALKLTYKPSLLQKYEQGSGSLNPTITLKAKDGRVFKQTYTFGIKSNTPPPKPAVVLAKQTNASPEPSYYVLCIDTKDLVDTSAFVGGKYIHDDIAYVTVNGIRYNLKMNDAHNGFSKKPAAPSFLENGTGLMAVGSESLPTASHWVLYYKTNIRIGDGNPPTTYHITLIDNEGVTSDEAVKTIEASGKTHTVTFSVVDGTGGTLTAKVDGSNIQSGSEVGRGKTVTFTANPDTVNGYEVEKWTLDDNEVSGHTSTEYTLYNITDNATVTVKFKKKIYTVTYRVEIVDGEAGGKIKADSGNFVENGSTSVEYGGSVTFTAHPTNTDWKVAEWKRDNAEENGTNGTYTISVTAATTVTVKFYQSTLKNPATWKDLARAVKSAPDNAVITINGEIQATDVANNASRIKVQKNLTIKGENNAILNAVGKQGIFDVFRTFTLQDITLKNSALPSEYSGGAGVYVNPSGTLIMKGSSVITKCSAANSGGGVYVGGGTFEMHDTSAITGCTASKGGGVYVSGGIFKMQDSAIVTPSTGSEQYTAGKNDVYLESGKMITVDGTLSNNPAARITVPDNKYQSTTKVLDGSAVGSEHAKFAVTPEKVTEDSENWNVFWYVDAGGRLKAEFEDPSLLQEVISSRHDNTPFIIKLGNISNLTNVGIPGNKKIMLKADREVTLTCPQKWNDLKHLQVYENASLTLKGPITLQGKDYGINSQYALYVEKNGKAEIKDGVTITGFKNAGRGTVFADGDLTMTGGTITGNKADKGGGVYIAPNRSFTMKGGSIKGNTAGNGGGVFVDFDSDYYMYGTFTMSGGRIEGNTADHGGGVFTHGSFTMSGGIITKNKANTDGKAVMLDHYFDWEDGEIKDNKEGNGAVIGGNVSRYLRKAPGNSNTES